MTNYDVASYPQAMQSPRSRKANKVGAAMVGGLAGMGAYYIPVTKNNFVDQAFKVHSKNVNADIEGLKQAAGELSLSSPKLSNESKILLNRLGVRDNLTDIFDKTKTLSDEITDSTSVKSIKSGFASGFEAFKKNADTMDNVASEAMKNIKWNNFRWGIGLGAALMLGISCLFDRSSQ